REQRGLAAAGRADDGEEFAKLKVEADRPERRHRRMAGRRRIGAGDPRKRRMHAIVGRGRAHFCRSAGRKDVSVSLAMSMSLSIMPTYFMPRIVCSRSGFSMRPSLQNFATTSSLTIAATSFAGSGPATLLRKAVAPAG